MRASSCDQGRHHDHDQGVVVIAVALVVVSVALLGSDIVDHSGADDDGDQLIGANPE